MLDFVNLGLLFSLLALIIFLLIIERIRLNRQIRSIPLRISVSGTRGKTSVVRLISSILRQSGFAVIAKTTGTEARYILPDGSEEKVKRIGATNILEQKKLIRKAHSLKADCVVAEIMSIQAENHWIESHKLIQPHFTVITNFSPDHIEDSSEEQMISLYMNDILPESTVVMEKGAIHDRIKPFLNQNKVQSILFDSLSLEEQNQEIAKKLSQHLGIKENYINEGIRTCVMDKGEAFVYVFERNDQKVIFVNGFAANDPLSSMQLISKTIDLLRLDNATVSGLFSWRSDRGERSKQWLDWLRENQGQGFDNLFYLGVHGQVFQRELNRGIRIKSKHPERITNKILNKSEGTGIVFGLGNIGGIGLKLIDYWENAGSKIELLK